MKWEIEYRTSHGTYESEAVDPEEPDGIGAMQAALDAATTSGPADETSPGNASRACWPVSSVRLEFYQAEMFHLPTGGAVGGAYFSGWENSGDAEWQSLTITGTGGASNGIASYLSVWEIKRVNDDSGNGEPDDAPPRLLGRVKVVRATPGGVAVVEQISPEVAKAGVTFSDGKLHLRPPPVPVKDKRVVHALALAGVEIIAEDGQAGVIGDRVRSNQGASAVRHFVTPKKTGEVDAEHLKFTVADLDAAAFSSLYEWKIEGGTAENGDAAHKKKVMRDEEEGAKVVLKVVNKSDQSVAAEMIAWVVWADLLEVQQGVQIPQSYKNLDPLWLVPNGIRFKFQFKVLPEAIIQDVVGEGEAPDFRGHKETFPGDLAGDRGVQFKWDVSRQVKIVYKNPAPTTWQRADFHDLAPILVASGLTGAQLPVSSAVIVQRPIEGHGNDDIGFEDEANNPYSNHDKGTANGHNDWEVQPPLGVLGSIDVPQYPQFRAAAGLEGESVAFETQFWEFVRLEINGKWHRISAYTPWWYLSKLKKDSGSPNTFDGGSEWGQGEEF